MAHTLDKNPKQYPLRGLKENVRFAVIACRKSLFSLQMKTLSNFLLFLGASMGVAAQETNSQYHFFGFSDDTKYASLEVYAEGPVATEPPSTRFIFVDVDKNAYATSTVNFIGKVGAQMQEVRKLGMAKAEPYFMKFKISGKNAGIQIPMNVEQQEENAEALFFRYNGVDYKLAMKSVPTGDKLLEMFVKKKMDLVLMFSQKTRILQRDNGVPSSRGFVVRYSLKDVYVLENKIAVVVEYAVAPGFEGVMDKYQMLVTGTLN